MSGGKAKKLAETTEKLVPFRKNRARKGRRKGTWRTGWESIVPLFHKQKAVIDAQNAYVEARSFGIDHLKQNSGLFFRFAFSM